MRLARISSVFLAIAALSALGCATSAGSKSAVPSALQSAPEPVHPKLPDLQQPTPNPEAVITGIEQEALWWAGLGGEGLRQAVERSLTYNRDLAVASARIERAEAQGRIVAGTELPRVGLAASQSHLDRNSGGFALPGTQTRLLDNRNSHLGLSLNMSWEPDLWGKVKSGKAAAAADVELARSNLAAARLSLAGQTAKAWFSAIEAERQVGIARASVESYELSVEAARLRELGGVPSAVDLQIALAELSQARANVERAQQRREATLRQLEILLGRYPDGTYAIAEDLPPRPGPIPAGIQSEAVHRRPDLLAAEQAILGGEARIAKARSELRPSFRLTGLGGSVTDSLKNFLSGESVLWGALGSFTQPLLNKGELKAAVRLREAETREATARYERAVLQAYGEVEIALTSDQYLASQEELLDTAAKRALKAHTLALERYRGGTGDISALLIAQRAALEAESAWLGVCRARLDNRVDLHLSLGGDFAVSNPAIASAPIGDLQ